MPYPTQSRRSTSKSNLSKLLVCIGAALPLTMFGGAALAHKTFVQPEKFVWAKGETVNVALTSALEYPDIQFGPKIDRIPFVEVKVAGKEITDISLSEHETHVNIAFTPEQSGFAMISTSSKRRHGEIEPKDTAMYLGEIGASDAVRAAFEALPGEPPMQRSYNKHSKTFFCIETCDAGREISLQPVGQALEFLAVAGSNDKFILVRDGKPLAAQDVSVYSPGSEEQVVVSDNNGTIQIDTDGKSVILLMSVWITLPEKADGTYQSDYATLTVDLNAP